MGIFWVFKNTAIIPNTGIILVTITVRLSFHTVTSTYGKRESTLMLKVNSLEGGNPMSMHKHLNVGYWLKKHSTFV
jgi:hypothetical protein